MEESGKACSQKEQKPSQIPNDLFFFLLSGYMCLIAEHPAKTFREILVWCTGTADSVQLLQPIQQKHLVQLWFTLVWREKNRCIYCCSGKLSKWGTFFCTRHLSWQPWEPSLLWLLCFRSLILYLSTLMQGNPQSTHNERSLFPSYSGQFIPLIKNVSVQCKCPVFNQWI